MIASRTTGKPTGANKRIVTGVALAATTLCAFDERLRGNADGAGPLWQAKLEPAPAEGIAWPSLVAALSDLASAVGVSDGVLAIALLPPLTEVRRLELPPLNDVELQRLLTRNAPRYFVHARGAQVVGAAPADRRARNAPVPTIASAASARLVAMVRTAAQQAGWTIASVAPAESAWAGGALLAWPSFARTRAWVLVAQDERTDLLQLDAGRLIGVRRFRAGAQDAAMIVDALGPSARVGIVGGDQVTGELSAALRAHGITPPPIGAEWKSVAESAESFAARSAGRERGPVLRGEEAVVVEQARARRAAWLVAAAAVVVLALSAGLELWGVHRQLRIVRAERERIRPEIASTMIGRTTVDATSRSLATLATIERESPQWSSLIATLSQAITSDAYLTAIRGRKDSLIVDGLAEHASRVFDALERSKVVEDVKSAAPVRRELQDDGTALDRFTIAARLPAPVAGTAAQAKAAPAASATPAAGGTR